jgi:hypothetical protein
MALTKTNPEYLIKKALQESHETNYKVLTVGGWKSIVDWGVEKTISKDQLFTGKPKKVYRQPKPALKVSSYPYRKEHWITLTDCHKIGKLTLEEFLDKYSEGE